MKFRTINFQNGHKLEDNGVGDYQFVCPAIRPRFVHLGLAAQISMGGAFCEYCKKTIGDRLPGEPWLLTTEKGT